MAFDVFVAFYQLFFSLGIRHVEPYAAILRPVFFVPVFSFHGGIAPFRVTFFAPDFGHFVAIPHHLNGLIVFHQIDGIESAVAHSAVMGAVGFASAPGILPGAV